MGRKSCCGGVEGDVGLRSGVSTADVDGIGRHIHENPFVSNVFHATDTQPLSDGLVLTIEPMIAERSGRVFEDDDGWTIRTADSGLSAHYEHTVLIREGKPILLTAA